MTQAYPLQFLVGAPRKLVFGLLVICYVVAHVSMSDAQQIFNNELTPLGVVSFEFATSSVAAQALLESWSPEQLLVVQRHTYIDFLYLLAYGSLLALLCESVSRLAGKGRFATAGIYLSWAACLAALLDVFENAGLLRILATGAAQPWPALVALAAGFKFLLIVSALLYLLASIPYLLMTRLKGDGHE